MIKKNIPNPNNKIVSRAYQTSSKNLRKNYTGTNKTELNSSHRIKGVKQVIQKCDINYKSSRNRLKNKTVKNTFFC